MAMSSRLLRPLAGFNPRSIAGLAAWWDASAASTVFDAASGGSVQSADDGLVARLEDRSGNSNHCTQSGVDTIKPILKTGQINGRNVLRFDGSDDRMVFNNIPATAFTVLLTGRKWNSATDTAIFVSQSAGVALPYLFVDAVGFGTYSTRHNTGVNGSFAGNTTSQLTRTTPFMASVDSSIAMWIDGTSVNIDSTGTLNQSSDSFNVLAARIGGAAGNFSFGKQEIGEVLFYNRVLSVAERQRAEGYLAWKWGLQSQLPYDHPYAAGFPGYGSQQTPSDPDALTYLSAVKAADGTGVEVGVAMAVDDFIRGCKADGTFSAIKASCILCGARTISGALVPLVGTAPTPYNFASGDYSRTTGLKGDGATKYLDSNRANNADGQDDNHNAVYFGAAATDANCAIGSGFGVIGANGVFCSAVVRNRNSTAYVPVSTTPRIGFVGSSRASSASYEIRHDGTTVGSGSNVSQVPDAANLFLFRRNDAGSPAFTNARLAFYSIGSALDLAALDNQVSTLVAAIAAAI